MYINKQNSNYPIVSALSNIRYTQIIYCLFINFPLLSLSAIRWTTLDVWSLTTAQGSASQALQETTPREQSSLPSRGEIVAISGTKSTLGTRPSAREASSIWSIPSNVALLLTGTTWKRSAASSGKVVNLEGKWKSLARHPPPLAAMATHLR